MKKYDYYIGIDPGTKTGLALWSRGKKILKFVDSIKIHVAFRFVEGFKNESVLVRVEDARKRTWFGNTGKERLKGAGSIERDCKIWEDFLTDNDIPFEMVHPKNNKTKLSAAVFKKMTGFTERTDEHGRDAAMLVFGL